MKINLFSLVAFSLVFLVSPVSAETIISQQLKDNKYPQTFVTNYMKNCIPRASAENLSAEEAAKLCQCTLKEFQKRYSFEEYQKITQQADTNPEAGDKLVDVGAYCFEELFI